MLLKNFNRVAFIFLILNFQYSFAQESIILKGSIKNSENQQKIPNTTLIFKGNTIKKLPSDALGDFEVKLSKGIYVFSVQALGYYTLTDTIKLEKDSSINIKLTPNKYILDQIEIVSKKQRDAVKSTQTGYENLKITEISKIPVLFGEKDILKTIQLKPGVSTAGEGSTGFFVRGGSADQNLVLLDHQQIYNPSHLLGFFSVFNADIIQDVSIYKGTQPSNFGGRLSSVLDVKTYAGNPNEKWHFKGGIGLISSRFSVSGPLVKNKAAFNFAARRTYADLFLKLAKNEQLKNNVLNFYDINASANYQISEKSKLNISLYNGQDNFGLRKSFGINWGNTTASLNWNYKINERFESQSYLIYTKFNYGIFLATNDNKITIDSRIQNFNFKQQFNQTIDEHHKLYYGIDAASVNINPQEVQDPKKPKVFKVSVARALDNALFFGDEITNIGKFNFNLGLRISAFSMVGLRNYYKFNQNSIDTISLKNKYLGKTYFNFEPRIAANYVFDENNSIKLFYGRNTQNIHVISSASSGSPTDVYLLSNYNIKPEISNQISLGYFNYFKNKSYELGVETYYKFLQNQVDYKPFTDLNDEKLNESSLLYGHGRAYGLEFYIQKKLGNLTGWIAYTLSRTERQINGINNNKYYPARQDRTHNISIVAMYRISKKIDISATWVYYTGNATTFPVGKYKLNNDFVYYYSGRNQNRMPDYHRMDISLNLKGKEHKNYQAEWNFSIYNLYGRLNAYSIDFKNNPSNNNQTFIEQTALFGMVPSVTYNFKF